MLVGRESDGYPVFQENFLRQGVKEFPYKESTLFKALVTNFSHCRKYGEGMTAAEYINQSFNGITGFRDGDGCATCGEEKAKKTCSKCEERAVESRAKTNCVCDAATQVIPPPPPEFFAGKSVQYCDQECQKLHWFSHKKVCQKLGGKLAKNHCYSSRLF